MKYLVMLLFIFSSITFGQFYGGGGTLTDPYLIKTASSLDSIRFGYLQGYAFKQIADIDLSGYTNWLPLGNNDTTFTGAYEGNGFIIKNLTITSVPEKSNRFHAGLFGRVGGTSLGASLIDSVYFNNIHLQNVDITGAYANGTGDLAYLGGLIGEVAASTTSDTPTFVDSSLVDTIDIKTTGNYEHKIGGLIGNVLTGVYGRVFKSAVENDSLTQVTSGSSQHKIGGLIGVMGSTAFSVSESWTRNSYIYGNRTANGLGGFIGVQNAGGIGNSYVYNAEVIDNAATLGSGFYLAGTFVGYQNGAISNSYATGTTIYNQELAIKTGFVGNMGSIGTNNFFDKLVAGTTNSNVDSTGATWVYPKTTDSLKTKATFTWRSWDFDTTWSVSGALNTGYPNLEGIFYTGYTLAYPSATGIVFIQDSVIEITWTTDVPDLTEQGTDTTFVWYALNDGFILIDTVFANDTSLTWTVPSGTYSTTARILLSSIDSVYTDSSDYFFTVIPLPNSFSALDIFDVTPSNFRSALDTVIISVETMNIDSFRTYWSTDSLSWYYITKTNVDTVNGFFEDTSSVQWLSPPLISGKVWIKAIEFRDTTLYYAPDTLIYAGSRTVAGVAFYITEFLTLTDCETNTPYQMAGSDGILKLTAIYDPSAGWNSNVSWRFYQVQLRENRTTGLPYYTDSYVICEAAQRQCLRDQWGNLIAVGGCIFPAFSRWIVKDTTGFGYYSFGADSTELVFPFQEQEGNPIIVNNRKYYTEKVGSNYYIKVTDLLNNYTQVYIDYTNIINTGGYYGSMRLVSDISNHRLGAYTKAYNTLSSVSDTIVYNLGGVAVGWTVIYNGTGKYDDALHQKLLDSLQSFGDYGKGYLLIGNYGAGERNTYSISLLPDPIYQLNLAQDIWISGAESRRDYFRGIHPKIWKNGIR